jgi:hypothetical protein
MGRQTESTFGVNKMNLSELSAELTKIFGHLRMVEKVESKIDNDCIEINLDGYLFYIVQDEVPVKTIAGERMLPGFAMSIIEHVPGRWNPYDGGDPPYDDEHELGQFRNSVELALKMATMMVTDEVNNICQNIGEAQMEKEWEEYCDSI